ncbi:hypothetical protein [Maricaulis sp.]|uniref:hypothetical protein n=1 Tax=Maricaulis sp. TaxID=1486257 RepID=UPI003A93FEF1
MKTTAVITALAMALAVSGCASRAGSIAPMSISANEYSGMSCEENRAELQLARDSENALTRQQNNAATADAAAVFLFLLPLGSVFGADRSGELAQVKGEVLALERALRTNCPAA